MREIFTVTDLKYLTWRHVQTMMRRDIITASIQRLSEVNSLSENGCIIFV